MEDLKIYIDFEKQSFYIAIASIVFNPTFWNIVARSEYKFQLVSGIFGGSKLIGCYALALTIFLLGLLRDYLFARALEDQPKLEFLNNSIVLGGAYVLGAFGSILVLTSMYKLGITGTYLGDYFGILMKERITSFPFNIMENPMYNGSTMVFLSLALRSQSPAGILLTLIVFVVYQIALVFEGSYTNMIYSKRK